MNVSLYDALAKEMQYQSELDGHRDRLRMLLAKRFGPVSARLNKRIEHAQMDDLDRWFNRIFDAKSTREIFADNKNVEI